MRAWRITGGSSGESDGRAEEKYSQKGAKMSNFSGSPDVSSEFVVVLVALSRFS